MDLVVVFEVPGDGAGAGRAVRATDHSSHRPCADHPKGSIMTGRLEGKLALVAGGAWGQGRNHAIRMAEEGAVIVRA
jgi:hypothetical protein